MMDDKKNMGKEGFRPKHKTQILFDQLEVLPAWEAGIKIEGPSCSEFTV
jgi:hypothetical protein